MPPRSQGSLFFLTCGGFVAPSFLVGRSSPSRARSRFQPLRLLSPVDLSLTVAVMVRESGDVVLVDAGFSEATCRDPSRELGLIRAKALGIRAHASDAIAVQLRRLRIDPARVTTVIATHLHPDHVGGVEDFPQAEVITTGDEVQAYRSDRVRYRSADLARAGRIRVVTLDGGPEKGFEASLDLFHDGSVVLLASRGHTAGGVSVALRGPSSSFLHVGDVAYSRHEIRTGKAVLLSRLLAHDRVALGRTRALVEKAAESFTIVPSHDRTVFESLPHEPPPVPQTREPKRRDIDLN